MDTKGSASKVSSLKDLGSIFKRENIKIFGIGGLPTTRIELCGLVPDFELICSNETGEIDSIRQKCKVNFFDLENNPGSKNPADIIIDEKVIDYITEASIGKKVGIYVFRSSLGLEKICKKNNWVLIAASSHLYEKLDKRLYFAELLNEIGLQREFEIVKMGEVKEALPKLFDKLGKKIVLQSSLGSGGRGSFFIKNSDDLECATKSIAQRIGDLGGDDETTLVANSFTEGSDVGIMGCVTADNGILVSYPRYQIIDFAQSLGCERGGSGIFCGHDWSYCENIPKDVCEQVRNISEKIGKKLKEEGYLGIFGVDFIHEEKRNELVPLEINPRLLGSFPVEVYVQLEKGEVPFVLFHILEFFKIKYQIANEEVYLAGRQRNGSHLILFNFWGREVEFKRGMKGGVYCVNDGKIKFIRNGFEMEDIRDKEREFILFDGVPVAGRVCKKNKKILRILAKTNIIEKNGHFNPLFMDFLRAVKSDLSSKIF